jgi:hypothetical protein
MEEQDTQRERRGYESDLSVIHTDYKCENKLFD